MEDTKAHLLSRRNFLKWSLLGLGGASVGAVMFGQQGGAVDYADPAYRYWDKRSPGGLALENYLVLCGALAPSAHNTQPWKFRVREQAIDVYVDFQRSLGQADTAHRMKLLSVGCALENIRIAAADLGFRADIQLADAKQFSLDQRCATIALQPDASLGKHPLFAALFERQTTRAPYDLAPIAADVKQQLAALNTHADLSLRWFDSDTELAQLAALNTAACIAFTENDPAYLDSLNWWRYSRNELLRKRDGISIFTSAAPALIKQYFQYGVSHADMAGDFGKTGEIDLMKQLFAATPLWGVISASASALDLRLQAGQLFERVFLAATARGYKIHAINYVSESPVHSAQYRQSFGLAEPQELLLMFRLGRAEPCEKSVRQPLQQIIV
jgi:nitroreductase